MQFNSPLPKNNISCIFTIIFTENAKNCSKGIRYNQMNISNRFREVLELQIFKQKKWMKAPIFSEMFEFFNRIFFSFVNNSLLSQDVILDSREPCCG